MIDPNPDHLNFQWLKLRKGHSYASGAFWKVSKGIYEKTRDL